MPLNGVYSDGDIPTNALYAGDTQESEDDLFVGRTVTGSDISTAMTRGEILINLPYGRVANTQLLGQIHPSHECLYVPWDGKEIVYGSYEVLKLLLRPNSLKCLCRNVIITATLGMSDRIDRLPLPVSIKDFCKVADQIV